MLPSLASTIIVSFVYASTDESVRRSLWSELISSSSDNRITGKPWAVLGDFNQVLRPSENSAALGPNVDFQTPLFVDALIQAELVDLSFRGPSNTWWNKRRSEPIAKGLIECWLMKIGS